MVMAARASIYPNPGQSTSSGNTTSPGGVSWQFRHRHPNSISWARLAAGNPTTKAGRCSNVPLKRTLHPPNPCLVFSPSSARANMPSLLVVIFAIELAVQLVNTIGAATINNLVRNPRSPDRCGSVLDAY